MVFSVLISEIVPPAPVMRIGRVMISLTEFGDSGLILKHPSIGDSEITTRHLLAAPRIFRDNTLYFLSVLPCKIVRTKISEYGR